MPLLIQRWPIVAAFPTGNGTNAAILVNSTSQALTGHFHGSYWVFDGFGNKTYSLYMEPTANSAQFPRKWYHLFLLSHQSIFYPHHLCPLVRLTKAISPALTEPKPHSLRKRRHQLRPHHLRLRQHARRRRRNANARTARVGIRLRRPRGRRPERHGKLGVVVRRLLNARAGVRGGGAAESAVLGVERDCGYDLRGAELYIHYD